MPEIPCITAMEAIRAFERAGFSVCRTKKHHIMKRSGWPNRLSIPVHKGKTLGVGLLGSQIKAAGLTIEQFREFLK